MIGKLYLEKKNGIKIDSQLVKLKKTEDMLDIEMVIATRDKK